MFMIMTTLSFVTPRFHSNSKIASLDISEEGGYPTGKELQMGHHVEVNVTVSVQADNSSEDKQFIRHDA